MLYSIKKRPLAFAIAAFCSPALASAESTDDNKPESEKIEEVQVWGTQVRASSLELSEEAIAIRQADHLSDLLRYIPGVDVGGAHSLNQRITIRSLDDKDLRVTIDGANQNTYMFHHMGNLQIHADILESADIDVGNNSVVNGGLGGVARFETRNAQSMLEEGDTLGGRLNLTLSDNASDNASVAVYGQPTEMFDFLGYVNSVKRKNYEVGGGKITDSQGNVIDGTDGTVRGLEGDLLDVLLKGGVSFNENHRLGLSYEHYLDEGDYSARPDMGLATDLAIVNAYADKLGQEIPLLLPTEFARDTITLRYDGEVGKTLIEGALYTNTSNLMRDESGFQEDPETGVYQNEGEAKNTGLNILARTSLEGAISQEWTYGIDYITYDTQYIALNATGGVVGDASEEATASDIFVQNRIGLGDKFWITPGARYNSWDIDSNLTTEKYAEPTFALAAEVEAAPNTLIKLSTTQLFKGPELSEVFIGAGEGDVYNEDLEAETGLNTQLGVAHQGEYFSAGVTAFETQIENYIYDYIDYTLYDAPFPKDNIGDMRMRGIEAYWGLAYENLDILLTYSANNTKLSAFEEYVSMDYHESNRDGTPVLDEEGNQVITPQEGFDGARTDRTAGDTFSIVVDYMLPSIDLHLHYDAMHVSSLSAGKDLDGASLDNSKQGYNLHNISARWTPSQFADGLALTLGIDNLFDEYYSSQASRTGVSFHPLFGELFLTDYEPGRNIKASVSYQF